MIKGIFTSGSGMQPRMLRLEVLANNLANIDTTGFKKENIFVELLQRKLSTEQQPTELAGFDVRQYTDFSEGSLRQTGNPLDLAIDGQGFFVVETPRGPRYTRNGHFKLANDGTIVNEQGYAVLGAGGRIQLPDVQKPVEGALAITESGDVLVANQPIGRFRIVQFEDLRELKKEGNSLFVGENVQPRDRNSSAVAVRQGYLEESNVEGIAEMIMMVELNRSFETDQKALQYQDATLERAMDVGRV